VVTDGESIKLRGKGIYFIRTTPHGKPVSPNGTHDNEVLFGEISEHIVPTLNIMINSIYKPLVERLEAADWNICEPEQKKEFMTTFEKFAKELEEAITSQRSKITLEPYQERFRTLAKNFGTSKSAENQEMILEFERVFNRWQEKIEATLAEADAEPNNQRDAGPMMELEYWKKRMRKLTGIAEQLRSKNCRTVVDVLDIAGRPSSD
jgi:dynein heavy chain